MKNAIVITLAMLCTAGGVINAAAQDTGPINPGAMDYLLHERFINTKRFAYTAGLPTTTNPDLETLSGAVATDGSGRIAGQVYARVYFGGPNNHVTDYGAFTITVTGNTHDRGTNPLVKFTMRGKGYTFDGVSNYPNANLSLTFKSTNLLVDVPPTQVTISSNNYSVTFLDGTTQLFADGPHTMTNSGFTTLSGTLKGNIKPGSKSTVNDGKQLTIKGSAALVTAGTFWTVENDTNFVEHALTGGLVLDVLTNIDARVVQPVPGSKLFLNAYVGSLMVLSYATGSAHTNTGQWSASFSGVAFGRGSNLHAKGDLGPLIVAYDPIPNTTNFLPRIVLNAIQDMTITSGKIFGQTLPTATSKQIQGISVPAPAPDP